jgi:hypothetical protein
MVCLPKIVHLISSEYPSGVMGKNDEIFLCHRSTSGYPARKFILQGNHITMFALSLDLLPSSHGLLAENCSPDIFGSNPKWNTLYARRRISFCLPFM